MYQGKVIHTIESQDIGLDVIKKSCPTCGRYNHIVLADLLGRIQPHDVGKQIIKTDDGVLQIENDGQMHERLAN